MKSLTALEQAMERWSNALWTLLIPPVHRQQDQTELVRTLHQECDDRALILDRQRILVPNVFVIELPPESHRQLADSRGPLDNYLSNHVRRHAAEQGYSFAGPVAVRLTEVEGNKVGRFRVRSCIAPTGASGGCAVGFVVD
ncbi:DUF3662 domain-containing protein [Streptomyces sp. NBC_00286]|uniref:DUF3662 domain-containing protein n=1 Tax=Streptomyces sp. NBC_00286 TaxID=2975701 RepID=UPI002E299732|nr:DUF3662 domain-containing protein [Streptomyces sp. NBC_00286]